MEDKQYYLKTRFTAWMKEVVIRARIDYLRSQINHSSEISIEDSKLTDMLIYYPFEEPSIIVNKIEFDRKILLSVFRKLTWKRRRILVLWVVHNLNTMEIAARLGCSHQNVSALRKSTLKQLKNMLKDGNY